MVESGRARFVQFELGHKGVALTNEDFGVPKPVHSSVYRVCGNDGKMYFMKVPCMDSKKKEQHTQAQVEQFDACLWGREHAAHVNLRLLDKPHANIVGLVDFVQPSTRPGWLCFEMGGPDLYEHYFGGGPRPNIEASEIKLILEGILSALVYMHARKFAHCDLRLENVLTSAHAYKRLSSIKVCDLGRTVPFKCSRIKDWNIIDGDAPELLHPDIYGKVSFFSSSDQ